MIGRYANLKDTSDTKAPLRGEEWKKIYIYIYQKTAWVLLISDKETLRQKV